MPTLNDNLRGWRDAAYIDWFSHFIKAWIPFNAWMTNTYGDLRDSELLDRVKAGSNVVFNRIVPIMSKQLRLASDTQGGWQDESSDAKEFRSQIDELHRLLQSCVVEGRRGRVSFETVDIGANLNRDEQMRKWNRDFRVRRDHPSRGEVTLELSATASRPAYSLTLPEHNRRQLEDTPSFQALELRQQAEFRPMFENVAPRKVMSVLAPHGATDALVFGTTTFINDPNKVFSALADVIYSLRNALFHGSITPNEQHNEIYEPAYHIVMRFVRCTI